jgi:transposase-like protein
VKAYQEEVRKLPYVPKGSLGRSLVGPDGIPNKPFLGFLFSDHNRGVKFLQECGLLKSEMFCPKCGSNMRLWKSETVADKHRWRCGKGPRGARCNGTRSLRHASWFTKSKLNLLEVMLLTYDILEKRPALNVKIDWQMNDNTTCDWSDFCKDVIIEYVESKSEMIGGEGKVVEVDGSKFGKRKYHRGHYVRGQWVFGGVERGSCRTFLVAVHDRSAETLIGLIKQWILPGTTIITDCWKAYSSLSDEGYKHLTVNHSVTFVDKTTGAHTNTIESTWKHVKASLSPYNRKAGYVWFLAAYMFRKKCKAENVDVYCKFMEIVAGIDWSTEPQ